MVKKLAIDWDEHELRYVSAECSGRSVKVIEAKIIEINGRSPQDVLIAEFSSAGLSEAETLIAIGRGKAELRELQLPPVPQEELPDMVRFQSLRSFANIGDSSVVDYLITKQRDSGVEVIAAAVAPQNLDSIRQCVEKASLSLKRIALRPLAAAALYLSLQGESQSGEVALIDLLSDSAEIVIARDGKVVFVRTVRMPSSDNARGKALAGELKRSLIACGVINRLQSVVLWGTSQVHAAEIPMLEETSGCSVQIVNPFELVEVDRKTDLPEHVGRLAPLLGLLLADEVAPDRLIDFLNPRKPEIKTESPYKKIVIAGVPVAAGVLLALSIYGQIASLDKQIAELRDSNAAMQPDIKLADESLAKTETVDAFLDGDVNWLQEIRRMAVEMPPSDQMIIRGVSAGVNARTGGGVLKIEGGAVNPAVIDEFEKALRDENHQVNGTGASEQKTEDAFRWEFSESISVTGSSIRDSRYIGISQQMASEMTSETDIDNSVVETEGMTVENPQVPQQSEQEVRVNGEPSDAIATQAADSSPAIADATDTSAEVVTGAQASVAEDRKPGETDNTGASSGDNDKPIEGSESPSDVKSNQKDSEEGSSNAPTQDSTMPVPPEGSIQTEKSEANQGLEVAKAIDAEGQR
ncbi:hypothetical protein N9D38_10125 [Rubripirellula sp.]|nr:hypothetical protein [Rubripirellula sp.]